MQDKIQKEYQKYYVNGASKKIWFDFYRRLCVFYNVDRRIQLGLRGVPIESIIEKCRDLVETGRPLHHQKQMEKQLENKSEEKTDSTTQSASINLTTVQNKKAKIMLNFSVLIDENTFLSVVNLISGQTQTQ